MRFYYEVRKFDDIKVEDWIDSNRDIDPGPSTIKIVRFREFPDYTPEYYPREFGALTLPAWSLDYYDGEL